MTQICIRCLGIASVGRLLCCKNYRVLLYYGIIALVIVVLRCSSLLILTCKYSLLYSYYVLLDIAFAAILYIYIYTVK